MPSFCVVSNCELKYSHSENVSFHKFPLTNPELLAKWIKFTDRGLNWRPSRWSSICSRHFDSSDFREYLSRKCLKKTAIPTIVTKNNISYETYQICENNSCENTRTMHSELDDDLAVAAMEQSQHNEKSESEAIENCRLCGERGDEHLLNNSNPTATLDDHEIDAMFRKCLPTVSIHSDVDQSRAVCVDCVSQLRQYSDFIDKVLSYQRDLDLQSNNDSFISTENILRGKGINFCPKNQTSSTTDATMFIKQEPINVKQEIFDNSTKKQNGFEFTTQILTPPAASAIVTSAATGIDSTKQINVVQQEIRLPNADIDMTTYCRLCDRIFGSNFEFKMHNCCAHSFNNDSQEPQNSNANNNCEIMEIITLNNPVSFIDLAEDDNNAANCEINQLKMENNVDAERRERVERDHAYAKRMTSTPCQMKQEIVEGNYSDLEFSFAESEAHSTVLENEDQNTCSLDASISQISQPIGNTEVACPKCNQMFASQQLIEEHTQSMHTLKNKICSICSAEFKSVYDFLLHKNKMHSVQCKQCKQKFSTSLALKKHERQCTSESTDFCYSCRHCGKRIKNLIKMKEHLRICTEKPNPSEGNSLSNVSFQNDATVNKRMSLQKFICDICYRTFSRLKYFNLHKEMHQKYNHEKAPIMSPLVQPTPATEKINDEPPLSSQNFKVIVDNSTFIFSSPTADILTPNNQCADTIVPHTPVIVGKFVCDTCGQPFPTFLELKQHQTVHESERKYNCSLCTKTFRGISGLKQHISGFHYKIKPYSCPVCGYSYALKGDMQRCRHSKMKKSI